MNGMRGVPVTVTFSVNVAVISIASPLWYVLSSPAELSASETAPEAWVRILCHPVHWP
ncbi:MAG: hypothetical protein OXU74_12630 [Gemmatimonadota bacterium]|nr:hypothetical protein [Gemmatimonadota bacterium]